MSELRLALISSGLGYTRRGIEVWMSELARLLPEQVDVQLWSGGPERTHNGRPVKRLFAVNRDARWMQRWDWSRRYLIEQWSALPAAVAWARATRRNVLYCGDPVLSWKLKKLRRWHGAKVVFMNGMRLSPSWAQAFDGVHLLAPPYLEHAQQEVGLEQAGRFFAVPHFADTAMFAPPTVEERLQLRRQFGLPENAFIVLTVGPVGNVSGKRLEWLAEELSALPEQFVLVSVGGDEPGADGVRQTIRGCLGSRAVFLGSQPRDRVALLYRCADVYSLGSLAEPFSIAILEALASGLPVVHHHDGVMTWQTGNGGVPIDMQARGAARQVFADLAGDVARQQAIGAESRQLAEARYDATIVCRDLIQQLEQVAAGTPPVMRSH